MYIISASVVMLLCSYTASKPIRTKPTKLECGSIVTEQPMLKMLPWRKPRIFYFLENSTERLKQKQVENELQKAFNTWSEYNNLTFVRTDEMQTADVMISFKNGPHGDGWFGKDIFGHANQSIVHFNEMVMWSGDDQNVGTNFFAVAVHEIGHVLGLEHSQSMESIMYPRYIEPEGDLNDILSNGDIVRICGIYGNEKCVEKLKETILMPSDVELKKSTPECTFYFDFSRIICA